MFRNNQNDLNYSPQEVGLGGGYGGYAGAPVIAPTFVSGQGSPYGFAPPVAPIAPVVPGFGGGFGGFGGFGNGGILEAALLFGLLGGNGFGNRGHNQDRGGFPFPFPFPNPCKDDDNNNPLAILAAIAGAKDATIGEGRAGLAAIANAKDTTVAEARALGAAICDSEKTNLQQFNALAIQNFNNTQSIKDQSTAQTAAILARLNDSDVQRLRDELFEVRRRGSDRDLEVRIENVNTNTNAQLQAQAQLQLQRDFDEHRRRFDNREIEINNINTNTNVQAQLQAQAQRQAIVDLDRDHRLNARFDALFNQQNKVAQDIINVGSGVVGATQTANPTNVNSKNLQ